MSGWDPAPPAPKKRDKATIKAERDGFQVITRVPNQLLLDLDDGRDFDAAVFEKICAAYGRPKVQEWRSKSGRGRHVVLTFGVHLFSKAVTFTDAEATALEAALGSDPVRAVMNIRRIQVDAADPDVLFRSTEKVAPELYDPFDEISQEQQRTVFAAGARMLEDA